MPELRAGASVAYEDLRATRQRTLVAAEDDMWAAFADLATPYAFVAAGRTIGRFSVDDEHQLHGFFVVGDEEPTAPDLLARAVRELGIRALIASTVDPTYLGLALDAGGTARPVALLYEHPAATPSEAGLHLRVAATEDHEAAVAFNRMATGSPESFLGPYLARLIDAGELHLVEDDSGIVACGECRVDQRSPGFAHLGFVVGPAVRNVGLGTRLMQTLAGISRSRGLTPLCSTEPGNLASRTAIRRSGFRLRHRVYRIAVPTPT